MRLWPNSGPVSIICGHYGSGKTNIAVNLALGIRENEPGTEVTVADLDIVNPYFRTADNRALLESRGIAAAIPEFANSNVDIPVIPPRMMEMLDPVPGRRSVLDVGGDDGSVVLGMYSDRIKKAGYEMIYVINMYRPLISDPKDAFECMLAIEEASRLSCTGIINNSSLGPETGADTVLGSVEYAKLCADLCGIPLLAHTYCPRYTGDLGAVIAGTAYEDEPFFPILDITKKLF